MFELLTVKAAADVLKLNRFTVYELIRSRQLRACRVGPKNDPGPAAPVYL
jgi:excisionase family DNA binding protein